MLVDREVSQATLVGENILDTSCICDVLYCTRISLKSAVYFTAIANIHPRDARRRLQHIHSTTVQELHELSFLSFFLA